MELLTTTVRSTLHDHKRKQDIINELKAASFGKKSTTIKINGHNMLAEWTDPDSRKLL
jgi:hypothetical protein